MPIRRTDLRGEWCHDLNMPWKKRDCWVTFGATQCQDTARHGSHHSPSCKRGNRERVLPDWTSLVIPGQGVEVERFEWGRASVSIKVWGEVEPWVLQVQWGKQHCKSPGTVEEHKTGEKIKGTGETRKRFRTGEDPRKKRSGKDKETVCPWISTY